MVLSESEERSFFNRDPPTHPSQHLRTSAFISVHQRFEWSSLVHEWGRENRNTGTRYQVPSTRYPVTLRARSSATSGAIWRSALERSATF